MIHTPLTGEAAIKLLQDFSCIWHKRTVSGAGRKALIHDHVLSCSQDEWRYLLSGEIIKEKKENSAPAWLYERAWGDILALSSLKNFSSFANDFVDNVEEFRAIFHSPKPHRQVPPTLSA